MDVRKTGLPAERLHRTDGGRRGVTLLEMVAVLTGLSVLGMVAVTMLNVVQHTARLEHEFESDRAQFQKLRHAIESDLRVADSVVLGRKIDAPDGEGIVESVATLHRSVSMLASDGCKIEYGILRVEDDWVIQRLRLELSNANAKGERFPIPESRGSDWNRKAIAKKDLVSMDDTPPIGFRIDDAEGLLVIEFNDSDDAVPAKARRIDEDAGFLDERRAHEFYLRRPAILQSLRPDLLEGVSPVESTSSVSSPDRSNDFGRSDDKENINANEAGDDS